MLVLDKEKEEGGELQEEGHRDSDQNFPVLVTLGTSDIMNELMMSVNRALTVRRPVLGSVHSSPVIPVIATHRGMPPHLHPFHRKGNQGSERSIRCPRSSGQEVGGRAGIPTRDWVPCALLTLPTLEDTCFVLWGPTLIETALLFPHMPCRLL